MKPSLLITGGNRGVGAEICEYFSPGASSVSRTNGFDIGRPEDRYKICQKSLEFDIFVNHAHNGHLEGQTRLLYEVFQCWKEVGKQGYIFNTGSIATYLRGDYKRFSVIKRSLEIAHQQCCKEIENGLCTFRMTLIKPGMLDTPESRQKPHWPGHGLSGVQMAKLMEFCYQSEPSTLWNEVIVSSIGPAPRS